MHFNKFSVFIDLPSKAEQAYALDLAEKAIRVRNEDESADDLPEVLKPESRRCEPGGTLPAKKTAVRNKKHCSYVKWLLAAHNQRISASRPIPAPQARYSIVPGARQATSMRLADLNRRCT